MSKPRQPDANSLDDLDEWEPDAAEVLYLTQHAGERQVILAIGTADGIPAWQIGKVAGFARSGRDEEAHKANWMSSVSRATRKNGRVRPAIKTLQAKLAAFRKGGGEPRSFTRAQMLARCDFIIENGTPSESLRAIQVKHELTGKDRGGGEGVTGRQVVAQFVGAVGAERTRRALRQLGIGYIAYKYKDLFPEDDTESDEIESRIERLKAQQHGQGESSTGPAGGSVGGSIGGLGGRGTREPREAAPEGVGSGPTTTRGPDERGERGKARDGGGGQRRPHPATVGPATEYEPETGRPVSPEPSEEQVELMRGFQQHIGLGSKDESS